ncbi:MAG: hypothetical protein ABI851_12200 [Saprospiraceae bacterium]
MSYIDYKNKILAGIAGFVLEVERLNDKGLEAERLATCEGCPMMDKINRQCKICTCFIDAKVGIKVNHNPLKLFRPEVTHCPLGKWNDKDLANHYRQIDGLKLL